ncbi:hypothetical protein NDU88_004172 [Pleurodeles waltl]|uniref:Uncharacterized protein n=1 Tax=Pleurodeles waltl TaxID=8319 RepID=A0AAV7V0M9_PLEWA|nr:hypothetical protein NDU88_004172 [Pleurodeles waltl]
MLLWQRYTALRSARGHFQTQESSRQRGLLPGEGGGPGQGQGAPPRRPPRHPPCCRPALPGPAPSSCRRTGRRSRTGQVNCTEEGGVTSAYKPRSLASDTQRSENTAAPPSRPQLRARARVEELIGCRGFPGSPAIGRLRRDVFQCAQSG